MNQNSNKNNSNKPKKPIIYYYAVVMLVLAMLNLVMVPFMKTAQIEDANYSTFVKETNKGNVKEVHIKKPSDAMEKGIILLPEDRQKEGLIMSWGLGRNVTLPTISKYAKSGLNDEKTERELAKKLLEEVDTKAVDIFQPASSLSGGNQQKVVVAKALSQEMKVVIMDEPTKGVDVGAKAEIYAIMGELAKKGYAIILISSEMPEILGMADRIVVMCNGRKTGELNRGEATQERILELAMEKGHTGGAE